MKQVVLILESRVVVAVNDEGNQLLIIRGETIQNSQDTGLDTLRMRQNGHFPDDIFKCIFLNENV